MTKEELYGLIEKYIEGNASPEEITMLNDWYRSQPKESISGSLQDRDKLQFSNEIFNNLMHQIHEESGNRPAVIMLKPNMYKRAWIPAAAVILVLLSVSGYFLFTNRNQSSQIASVKQSLTPGTDKAILKLSDGREIILDNQQNGLLAEQSGVQVIRLDSGLLAYKGNAPGNMQYNTLITPRGGRYQVMLPDGSQVWLNSASTLYYPTSFTGSSREVELTGEGYFEVKKNVLPFIVKTKNQKIQVLGTGFNVMAYDDEGTIQTSLVNGSVKVTAENTSVILKPGEQGISTGKNTLQKSVANLEEVLAWKEGKFRFDDAHITKIMRQIVRWYDVEVVYEGVMPEKGITGFMSRTANAEELLEVFEETGLVHFNVVGKKITVLNGPEKNN